MGRRADIEISLRRLVPQIPSHEFAAITDHAVDSRGLSTASPEAAAWLALVAYVRHMLTDYDELLEQGYDQESARHFVADRINTVLIRWGSVRRLEGKEPDAGS